MQEKVKKKADNIRNAGRKKLPSGTAVKNYTVCIREVDRDSLVIKYGSLSAAIKSLLP